MRLVGLRSFLSRKSGFRVPFVSFVLTNLSLGTKRTGSSDSRKNGFILTTGLALRSSFRHLYKLLFVTFIAYAFGAGLSSILDAKPCYGWSCEIVECNDGYAVHIPDYNKYLPCEKFDEFIKTKNMRLLK